MLRDVRDHLQQPGLNTGAFDGIIRGIRQPAEFFFFFHESDGNALRRQRQAAGHARNAAADHQHARAQFADAAFDRIHFPRFPNGRFH